MWIRSMSSGVRNNTTERRFELDVEGHLAVACYTLSDGVMTFTHTQVPPELSGRGVASRLIGGALDEVRALGLRVVQVPVRRRLSRQASRIQRSGAVSP